MQFNEGEIDDDLSSGDDETEDEKHCLNTKSEEAVDLSSLTLKDKVFFIF